MLVDLTLRVALSLRSTKVAIWTHFNHYITWLKINISDIFASEKGLWSTSNMRDTVIMEHFQRSIEIRSLLYPFLTSYSAITH